MRARPAQLGLVAWITCAGCTSWSRLPPDQPVPDRGTIQVWSAGEKILVRDARAVDDSLVGRLPDPDTTELAFAVSSIDSLRTQSLDAGKMVILGAAVGVAVFYAVVHMPGGE